MAKISDPAEQTFRNSQFTLLRKVWVNRICLSEKNFSFASRFSEANLSFDQKICQVGKKKFIVKLRQAWTVPNFILNRQPRLSQKIEDPWELIVLSNLLLQWWRHHAPLTSLMRGLEFSSSCRRFLTENLLFTNIYRLDSKYLDEQQWYSLVW